MVPVHVTRPARPIAPAAVDVTDRPQLDDWMTAAAEGDRAAIDPLFHALRPLVTRYATRFLGDPALAEVPTQARPPWPLQCRQH